MTLDALQEMLDTSPFSQWLGLQAEGADKERQEVALRMPYAPHLGRLPEGRQVHGGPIAALIDIAGDFALILVVGGGVPTLNLRVDYLRPAVDTDLVATARVRRAGRTIGVVDVDVRNDDGKLVAVGRGSYGTWVG